MLRPPRGGWVVRQGPKPPPGLSAICMVFHSPFFLKLCAFAWLQSTSSWYVAVFNKGSLGKVPPTPSLSSLLLGLTPLGSVINGLMVWCGLLAWHNATVSTA